MPLCTGAECSDQCSLINYKRIKDRRGKRANAAVADTAAASMAHIFVMTFAFASASFRFPLLNKGCGRSAAAVFISYYNLVLLTAAEVTDCTLTSSLFPLPLLFLLSTTTTKPLAKLACLSVLLCMLFCRCCCCCEVYVCEQQQHVLIAIAISTNCPKGNSFCWKLLAGRQTPIHCDLSAFAEASASVIQPLTTRVFLFFVECCFLQQLLLS